MKKLSVLIVSLLISAFVFNSCIKETPIEEQENIPSETSVTGHAEDITPLGATLICYANLPNDISAGTSFGVIYSLDDSPSFETAFSKISTTLDSHNKYSVSISGLQPGTKYFYRSFVNQNGILRYGRVKDFATKTAKIISTGVAEKVSAISASIPVILDLSDVKFQDISVGVCYSEESENPDIYKDKVILGTYSNEKCIISLMALTPGTSYHYRAYAIIDGALIYGDSLSFITGQDCIATTNEPTEVNHISAVVSGTIDLTDCVYQTAVWGICYDILDTPTLESNVITVEKLDNGIISTILPNLEPDKVYYYKAFTTIDNKTHFGATLYFRTPALFKETSINDVSSVSAKVITEYNMAETKYSSTEFGICFKEKGIPTISDNTKKADISESGVASIDITGLSQDTKYFIRPYAKLNGILVYGDTKDFTTLGLITSATASNISGVSARIAVSFDLSNAIYGNGEFGICYGTSTTPTTVALGDLSDGNVEVTISALQSKSKYYYRGYAKLDGKIYYGETLSLTTAQFVNPAQASNISPVSATVTASYQLTDAIFKSASFGVCLSKNTSPTTNDITFTGAIEGDNISVAVKRLSPATSYYYRSYAVVDGTTHYGDVKQFATGEARFSTANAATDITFCSASLSGVYNLGNSMYDSVVYGMCYSDKASPSIANYTVTATPDASGNATFTINNLICSTEYYYKPYVTIDGATYYGTQRMFETAWDPFVVAEIEAGRLVDLGLSVHWATYNIGATKPEEIGNLYAWGELTPKETYSWQNYKFVSGFYNGHPIFSKYSTGLEPLEDEDDVACSRLGGTYRMPTEYEINELVEKCTWTIEDVNGIKGYKATGPNGNSIFLPTNKKVMSATDLWYATYWTKSPFYYSGGAYYQETVWGLYLYINSETHSANRADRYIGNPVRAVSPY